MVVPITIRMSRNRLKVTPNRAKVPKSSQAVWSCKPKKPFVVVFDGKAPFKGRAFFPGHSKSGKPTVKPSRKKVYKYSVYVGSKSLDPGVIVW